MNLANTIWGYKTLVGSNTLYSKDMCEKVNVDDKSRAVYSVKYNGKDTSLDVEVVVSLVLQYCYYRCLHTESVVYDTFPIELPELVKQPHCMAISVVMCVFSHLDSILLHSFAHPWLGSCSFDA